MHVQYVHMIFKKYTVLLSNIKARPTCHTIETHWIRRADVQYTSPLTMLFTIGFSDACILVIRL